MAGAPQRRVAAQFALLARRCAPLTLAFESKLSNRQGISFKELLRHQRLTSSPLQVMIAAQKLRLACLHVRSHHPVVPTSGATRGTFALGCSRLVSACKESSTRGSDIMLSCVLPFLHSGRDACTPAVLPVRSSRSTLQGSADHICEPILMWHMSLRCAVDPAASVLVRHRVAQSPPSGHRSTTPAPTRCL